MPAMADERYNILLITSDQHRWDCLGRRNPHLQTPHLDRLAGQGIIYDRAYTCNPVCTPARVSMLTGHYPSRHGCYTIGTSLPQDYPTVPSQLGKAGVYASLIGKAHFQPCTNEPLGNDIPSIEAPPRSMDFDFFRRWQGPYFGFEDVRLAIGHASEPHAASMHYGAWLCDQGCPVEKYFGTGQYTDFGRWELPERFHNSTWTADQTIASLQRAQAAKRPFFIWSSFQDPHNPCVVPEPWASMYRPEDMPEFDLRPGEFADRPPFYDLSQQGKPLGHPDLQTDKAWYCCRGLSQMDRKATRGLAAAYYGMVSLMDHHIGRVLDHLEATGQARNTIVIFTTDHGDYLGNHGLWWKGLPAYDDAQRIPFIVRHPRCATPGQSSAAFQSLVDIPLTAMAALGLAPSAGLQGINQIPAWQDANASCRDWALCEYRPTESPFMQKTFVHDRWKLVVYHETQYGELYDLAADPGQSRNLWDDPAAVQAKSDLLLKFISTQMETDGILTARTSWA
jgi:uncharacterized sulfatase